MHETKKLCVTFRIESGCLGPTGEELIEAFCPAAKKMFMKMDIDFIIWNIVPRHDKTLPEIEYKINNKKLSSEKTNKYLKMFDKELKTFEDNIHDKMALYIDEYLGH